jgi:hypothetical protein
MKQTVHAEKKRPAAEVEKQTGPRLTQILQHSIQPWKRETSGDEETQLAEIRRRPVRNRFDSEEAKRRLGIKPAKRSRTSRPAAKQVPV